MRLDCLLVDAIAAFFLALVIVLAMQARPAEADAGLRDRIRTWRENRPRMLRRVLMPRRSGCSQATSAGTATRFTYGSCSNGSCGL